MFAHFRAHSLYRHKFLTFSAHCAKQQVIAQLRGVISSISLTLKHVCFICFYSLRACANCLSCMYVCLCFYVYFFFFAVKTLLIAMPTAVKFHKLFLHFWATKANCLPVVLTTAVNFSFHVYCVCWSGQGIGV